MAKVLVKPEFVLKDGIRYNICAICKKEFRARIKGRGNLYRRTCSGECELELKSSIQKTCWNDTRKEYMSKLLTGRDTSSWNIQRGDKKSNWKGGYYHAHYSRIAFEEYKFDKKCTMCGSEIDICIHHKDKNRKNNTKENLEILCKSCHIKQHVEKGDSGWNLYNKSQIPNIGLEDFKKEIDLGKSMRTICKEYHTSFKVLNDLKEKYNIIIPDKIIPITVEQVKQHLSEGKSVRWMNREYNISSHMLVPQIIKDNNIVAPNRKYMKKKKML